MVFSLLLLVGLILVLNLSTLSAANVTSNTAPKVTSVNPINNSIILKSQTVKVYFNEPIKAGTLSIRIKNAAGTTISTKKIISYKTLSIIPLKALPKGVKYSLVLNSGSIKDLAGKGNSYYSTSFTVSPITLAQMKYGIYRVQNFYNTNLRLPHYVSFSTKTIPIREFQRIIATQGLKINTKLKDLTVTKVTAPTIGVKGNTITVPNTVKNQGNTAIGGFYVSYYLISNSHIYLGKRYISSLAAGASNNHNTKLKIPLNITSSSYYIDVYADITKIISESKEYNNFRYSTTKIQIRNTRPMNIGYFINPDSTPLANIDFNKLKSDGITEVYIHANNADYLNLKPYYSKIVNSGLRPFCWVWQGFTHAKEVTAMGYNTVMDLETYKMADFISEVKQLRQDTKGKTLILCTKADGWDGNQRWDLLAPLVDAIMPMCYLGDYEKSTSDLASYIKKYNTLYPNKIYPALETYMSDKTVKPKANSALQVEIKACGNVKGIGLFRYGLSN